MLRLKYVEFIYALIMVTLYGKFLGSEFSSLLWIISSKIQEIANILVWIFSYDKIGIHRIVVLLWSFAKIVWLSDSAAQWTKKTLLQLHCFGIKNKLWKGLHIEIHYNYKPFLKAEQLRNMSLHFISYQGTHLTIFKCWGD